MNCIGNIPLNKSVLLAPMEDVTDAAFRLICRQMGADIVYTEFTSSDAIIRDIPKAMRKITVLPEERPVAIQLFGGTGESMAEAARKAEALGPDFIDINCGCWVKNHVARGMGAALLKDLPQFERIVKSTVRATRLPVTVKTRLGWDQNNIVIEDVARMVEQAGAKAIAVHCRTRSQAHQGDVQWHWLEKIKQAVSIPVIGNGSVRSPQDVKEMLETGCDAVMIGRAAIGNPWIFRQSRHYLRTGELLPEPTLEEKIDVCVRHLKLAVDIKGIRNSVIPFRKFYMGYLKGIPHVAKLRNDLMQLVDLDGVIDRLYQFLEQNKSLSMSCV